MVPATVTQEAPAKNRSYTIGWYFSKRAGTYASMADHFGIPKQDAADVVHDAFLSFMEQNFVDRDAPLSAYSIKNSLEPHLREYIKKAARIYKRKPKNIFIWI